MKPFQAGLIVAAILAILTVLEYIFAVEVHDEQFRFAGLSIAAIAKAALICYFFMHIYRLWRQESHS